MRKEEETRRLIYEEIRVAILVIQTSGDVITAGEIIYSAMEKYGKDPVQSFLDELVAVSSASKPDIKRLKAEQMLTVPVDFSSDLN